LSETVPFLERGVINHDGSPEEVKSENIGKLQSGYALLPFANVISKSHHDYT
jgi:hypothetical protein